MKIRNEITPYERKIKELHNELESVARNISEKHGELTGIKSEINKLQLVIDSMKIDIERKTEQSKKIDDIIVHKQSLLQDVHEEIAWRSEKHSLEWREHTDRLIAVSERIDEQSEKLKLAEELNIRVNYLRMQRDAIVREVSNLEYKFASETKIFEDRKLAIETTEKEFKDFVDMVNRRAEQNEQDRALLETYVKRLQYYYDEHKINLNILPKFNIVADSK